MKYINYIMNYEVSSNYIVTKSSVPNYQLQWEICSDLFFVVVVIIFISIYVH